MSSMSPSVMPPDGLFAATAAPTATGTMSFIPSSFSSLRHSLSSGSVFSCSPLSRNDHFSFILSASTSSGSPIFLRADAISEPNPSPTSISCLPDARGSSPGLGLYCFGGGPRISFPEDEQSRQTLSFAPSTCTMYSATPAPHISHSDILLPPNCSLTHPTNPYIIILFRLSIPRYEKQS